MSARRRTLPDKQLGAVLVGIGVFPFAAATAIEHAGEAAPAFPCPFREATGLPCPLCGSTRAFALAAQGDTAFLEFNAVWVAAAVAAVVTGGVILFRVLRADRLALAMPLALGGVTVVAWAWALAHRSNIVT
jgi:hypothetical protein